MRRVVLLVVVVLLAVVTPASAKVGVELDKDPAALGAGEETAFRVMLLNEASVTSGEPQPIESVRALVTFTNARTGEVVRVRTGRSGRDGIAFGRVAFPSPGNWTVDLKAPRLRDPIVHGQAFEIGAQVRVMETMEPPAAVPPASGSQFPWLPLALAAGALAFAAALACFGPRRLRAHLPARFGGAA